MYDGRMFVSGGDFTAFSDAEWEEYFCPPVPWSAASAYTYRVDTDLE